MNIVDGDLRKVFNNSQGSRLGRQIAWMIFEHFESNDTDRTVLDLSDFLKAELPERQRTDFRHEVGQDHHRYAEAT